MKNQRIWLWVGIVMLIGLIFWSPMTGASNKEFVFNRIMEPDYLDPAHARGAGGGIIQQVYDFLFLPSDEDPGIVVPQIAERVPTIENGLISEDGRTITIPIRQGIKFHDGTELTAYDVEYSLQRSMIMNLPRGESVHLRLPLMGREWDPEKIRNSVVALDDYTIQLNLWEPSGYILNVLAYIPTAILSKDYVIANGGWNPDEPGSDMEWYQKEDEWLHRNMMGSGPFRFKEWVTGDYILLEAFEDYWAGRAYFDTVVINHVTEVSTSILMLSRGDAHGIEVAPQYKTQIERIPHAKVYTGEPDGEVWTFQFSQDWDDSVAPPGTRLATDFFVDDNVRKGFVYAFDFERYNQAAYEGEAMRATGPFPPNMWAYDPDSGWPEFDLDKATEYLKLAHDGKTWEEGFEFTLFVNAGRPWLQIAGEMLAENLRSINRNFIIHVDVVDTSVVLGMALNLQLPMWPWFLAGRYWDPNTYDMAYSLSTPATRANYENERIDELWEKAAMEIDMEKRKEFYSEVQKLYAQDTPALLMACPNYYIVFDEKIEGFVFNPTHIIPYFYSLRAR